MRKTLRGDEARRHLAAVGLDESHIEDAIKARIEARRNKDYKQADEIRNRLLEKGIALLDTPAGNKMEDQEVTDAITSRRRGHVYGKKMARP